MEPWEFDFEWLRVRHEVKDKLNLDHEPDLKGILFLIGVQELSEIPTKLTKEQKQDAIHISVCRLLSLDGYYELEGYDADGWPHWKSVRPLPIQTVKAQERMLKEQIIKYFRLSNQNAPEIMIMQ